MSPATLALVSVLQYAERLTDRQAAHTAAAWIDPDDLSVWERNPQAQARTADLRRKHNDHLLRRVRDTTIASPVAPRFALIHTLVHALINEWSLDASYPRRGTPRTVVHRRRHRWMLIYTATSDSAGT